MTVRSAVRADAERVFALASALATTDVPQYDAFAVSLQLIMDAQDQLLLVVEIAEAGVVGYLHGMVHPAFHANGPIGWVEELFVEPDQRGAGHGRSLMRSFETWVTERGGAYVSLATRRAAAFYGSLGYEESATYFRKPLR